jgi:hypothetical protein
MPGRRNQHRRELIRAVILSVLLTMTYAAIVGWPAIQRAVHFG